MSQPYSPRDFIETPEGLVFAVVDGRIEDGRVLCFLRYQKEDGKYRKLSTQAAGTHLALHAPEYAYYSERLDASLHGVPLPLVRRHFRPRDRVREILALGAKDAMEEKAAHWLRLCSARGLDPARVGLTGSLLIGAQTTASDLDFVIYDRESFFQARGIVRALFASGDLEELDEAAWREAYARRGCALDFADYLWHERRKLNKGLCDGVKFDISLIADDAPPEAGPARKLGTIALEAEVADARYAYDHPARYRLVHPEVSEVLSFTHTYVGQAVTGERVAVAGILEATASGLPRIVVGTSREAPGEYIKVVGKGR